MGKECFKIVIFCVLQKCIIVQLKHFCTTLQEFLTMRRYRWEKYKMMSLFHRNVQQRFVGQILLSKGHELRIYVKIGLYQLLFLLWCLMMDLITKNFNIDMKCDQEYLFALTYWDISIVHFPKAAEKNSQAKQQLLQCVVWHKNGKLQIKRICT